MLSVYPYGSGSLYNAAYAISASYAGKISYIQYVLSSSNAGEVLYPQSGSRGKGICLLTTAQYLEMVASGKVEVCTFT